MNWPGRVVLLIGMFVSAFLFWRKFGRALRIILAAKPDADFKLRPIGPRIRKVLWEVGAQGLVIAQRPLPGLAHALVFWGFCVFALVTLNHFATGLGFAFLSRDSFWGRGYFLIAGVFAVAVAISIAGLAFRRLRAGSCPRERLRREVHWPRRGPDPSSSPRRFRRIRRN